MKSLKRLSLLLVLLLLLSPAIFSEDLTEMTTAELLEEWEQILTQREADSAEKERFLNQREKTLNNQETSLNQKEVYLNERETSIKDREQYYKSLKEDNLLKNLEWFLIGSAVGLVGGGIAGIKIGVTIKL